ncbi:uncharacterized protein HD556DRAFT_1238950, partial [Suillus plorans]
EKERLDAEKKKPKMNGFDKTSSIGDFLTPRPAQYVIQKLTNFEFVELWYFSPDGCKEALRSSHSIAENDLSIMMIDDQLTLRPSSALKASKAALADHKLLFSNFLREKNLFLVQISKAEWCHIPHCGPTSDDVPTPHPDLQTSCPYLQTQSSIHPDP